MPRFEKMAPFLDGLESQDADFFNTLDRVLDGKPGEINDFMTANLPNALSWREEIVAAMLFCDSGELSKLPKIKEVLLYLSRIKNAKPAATSEPAQPQSNPALPGIPDLSEIAELKKA